MTPHPDPDRLRAFVAGRLADDDAAAVEAHLADCPACCAALEHLGPDSLLQCLQAAAAVPPAAPPLSHHESGPPAHGSGQTIGPYKLLQLIGEGGMGTVWMAEQERPVRRRVAVKLIRAGLDSRQVVARFEAERQALALMDHPNIAKVLDAGTTPDGRPYFVMELVKGVPINVYCDVNRLTTRERLELFVPVCQAIQHAHQKGVIHRDLKPSNILVTHHDGVPVPKVIDFGVAKATQHRLTERTLFTEYGQVVGTLEYMSPEQAELSGLDVDTRSDVYSLGVLLYELLTGSTPLERKRLIDTPFPEALRLIREEDPPKPSTRLSRSGDALPALSAARRTEPRRLPLVLRGDLDWIVMKALEKDRTRRYETANGLAADVQRYLRDEPIAARPPSAAYLLRKFARKHRGLAAAAAAVAAVLVAGIAVSTYFGVMASRRAVQAEEAHALAKASEREAVAARDVAKTAQGQAEEAKRRSDRQSADLLLDRALDEARQGRVAESLHWMLESLRLAPDDDFQRLVRTHLASWAARVPVLTHWLDTPHGGGAFSPDSRLMVTSGRVMTGPNPNRATLQVWDAATGRPLGKPIDTGDVGVSAPIFSPDGRTMLTVNTTVQEYQRRPGWTKRWDVRERRLLGRIDGHADCVMCAAWRPDGRRFLTGSWDGTVRTWDAAPGEPVGKPLIHPPGEHVYGVAYSPDGRCIVTTSDRNVYVWDEATGESLREPIGPYFPPARQPNATFTADSKAVVVGIQSKSIGTALLVYRLDAAATAPPLVIPFPTNIAAVAADGRPNPDHSSPDGRWIARSTEGFQLWRAARDASRPADDHDLRGAAAAGPPMQVTSDLSRVWTRAGEQHAQTGDVVSGRPIGVPVPALPVWGRHRLTDTADGRLAAALVPDTRKEHLVPARVWDIATGRPLGPPLHQNNLVMTLAFSPDGKILATGGHYHMVDLWDVATGRHLGRMSQGEMVFGIAFSPDSVTLAAATFGREVRLWDVATQKPIRPPLPHDESVWRVAINADGTRLAAHCIRAAHLWDVPTGQKVAVLPYPKPIEGDKGDNLVLFSPDGRTVLTGGWQGSFRLWDAATGRPLHPPTPAAPAAVECFAFSPDGRLVLAGHRDGTAQLWDVAAGRPLGAPVVQPAAVAPVVFRPDGRSFATVTADGSIRDWPVPTPLAGDVRQLELAIRLGTGLRLDSGQAVVPLTRGEWEELRRQWSEQFGAADWVLAPPLRDEDWHDARAADAEQTGRTFTARWHLDRALALRPDDWRLYARRARTHTDEGHWDQAADDYAAARKLASAEYLLAWYRMRSFQAADPAAKRWYLERVLVARPEEWRLYVQRAELHQQMGKAAAAEADQNRAIELGADELFLGPLATDYAGQGRWPAAARLLALAAERGSTDGAVIYRWGIASLKAADPAGYRAACARLLTEWPAIEALDNSLHAAELARLWALAPQAFEDWRPVLAVMDAALARLERLALAPDRLQEFRRAWQLSKGTLLCRAGRHREAVACLNEVGGEAGAFLALASSVLGEPAKAREWLAKQPPADAGADPWAAAEASLLRAEVEAALRPAGR